MSRAVSIETKAAGIKLVLFDVDGVLTDGRVLVHSDGTESKHFSIRDGIAMVWAQRAGIRVGLLSARNSPTTLYRAQQLGVGLVHQGVSSKLATYRQILAELSLNDASVAYMGDDIVDLAVLARAGLSAAPADAVPEVRSRVDWVSRSPAGAGAARELLETILRAQALWDKVIAGYLNEPGALEPTAPMP
ncbi:MAG: phenylphosphate carboxylase subunit delta [Acidobacteria bacterium]|nr:MAG: phenylphosphate carboxylase subunit delta [Acidobacteriota bacterium]PYR48188.1 MAG: phenylphosphate carboxylase subunit delta [Acidobacteriota bacterium]